MSARYVVDADEQYHEPWRESVDRFFHTPQNAVGNVARYSAVHRVETGVKLVEIAKIRYTVANEYHSAARQSLVFFTEIIHFGNVIQRFSAYVTAVHTWYHHGDKQRHEQNYDERFQTQTHITVLLLRFIRGIIQYKRAQCNACAQKTPIKSA